MRNVLKKLGFTVPGSHTMQMDASAAHSSSVQTPEEYLSEEVACLRRCADFMTFFFQHVTCCPPRGPFRFYSALTFVARARHRYGPEGLGSEGDPSPWADVYRAIHVHSVLELMDVVFATTHLGNWPLFYIPSEVHAADLEALSNEPEATVL